MKTFAAKLMIAALLPVSAFANSTIFANEEGCVVEVEQRRNGVILYITDADRNTAYVGLMNDLSHGEITAFCPTAAVQKKGNLIRLGCDKNREAGSYTTRGQAQIDLTNGLSAVAVRGEYKKLFGWKVDTDIVCTNLKKQ